jgi:cycloeucalenol cycloisomerase
MEIRPSSLQAAKRRVERLHLFFTPLWTGAVGLVLLTGAFRHWGDVGLMLLGLGMALPLWAIPLFTERERPLPARYALKATLFLTVLSFVQNYFGAPLFFRFFGMEYHFNASFRGNGSPWFLSLMTVAYFSTYFAIMQALLRLLDRRLAAVEPLPLRRLLRGLACAGLGCSMAFLETLFMANELLRGYFAYASKARMLSVGSLCYGTLLALALPLYARIDEDPQQPTPLGRVLWEVLGVNMLVLICYELYSLFL